MRHADAQAAQDKAKAGPSALVPASSGGTQTATQGVYRGGAAGRALYVNMVYIVCLEDYSSVLLLSYSISSGALGSPDLLLSHLIISLACHISIILISTLKHCIITTTGTSLWSGVYRSTAVIATNGLN